MLSSRIHHLSKVWIVLFVLLSAAPELRFGDVQLIEVLQLVRVAIAVCLFFFVGMKFPRDRMWRRYGPGYALFLAFVCISSVIALRLTFYSPSDISILKQPVFLSLRRLLELGFAIYFMLAISDSLRQRPAFLRTALTAYATAGTVSAAASIAGFLTFQITGETTFFVNDLDHRVQGFFNEGGPYGLFLTSVILVLLMRRRLFPQISGLAHWLALAVTGTAWVLSFSK